LPEPAEARMTRFVMVVEDLLMAASTV